ncbi:MAG: glycosyltransferase family 4 protein, partial [Patescibacteria group bacterium]
LLDDPIYVQRLHHMATPIFAYSRLQALKYYIGHHEPEILHSYGFWYQPADVTARYAKRHNIPFIFHPLYYENENRQKLIWQLYKSTIGKRTFAAADVVVVISPFEQALIEKAGLPVKRFELIPPGVDTTKFDRPRLNPYPKKNIQGKILLTVSRVSAGKGLEELVEAFPLILEHMPETHLVIVGEDFGMQDTLQQQARAKGTASRVHFWGKVDDETLVAAYQYADIFLHPSLYEAFGIVLAEALAAGTPVVARNASAIPFVSPHEKTGLLFNTSKELIQHTVALLKNQSLQEKFAQAGMRHVRENFMWEKSIGKILKLYEEFKK